MVDEDVKTSAPEPTAEQKHQILIDQAKVHTREAMMALRAAQDRLRQIDTQGAQIRVREYEVALASIAASYARIDPAHPEPVTRPTGR